MNAEGGIWPTIVVDPLRHGLAMLIVHAGRGARGGLPRRVRACRGASSATIRFAADSLASVPSIVMGLFGFALFVEAMGIGLSMLSAALALSFLMLPIVMRATEEAIRAVPELHPLGQLRPGRDQVADGEQRRAARGGAAHHHRHRPRDGPRGGRDGRRHLHDGAGDQPAALAARLRAGR